MDAELTKGIAWWNGLSGETRKIMLKSPKVKNNPSPARCWEVFGSKGYVKNE